jgi:hypothetical protein
MGLSGKRKFMKINFQFDTTVTGNVNGYQVALGIDLARMPIKSEEGDGNATPVLIHRK